MTKHWQGLLDADAENGYNALCQLIVGGDTTVDGLRDKLTRAAPQDLATVPALIKQLDEPEFRKRDQADVALKAHGMSIEPILRKSIATAPNLEVQRRLEKILGDLAAETRRQERAIEALEMIGTPNACAMVADLAEGEPNALLTRHAKDAKGRLLK